MTDATAEAAATPTARSRPSASSDWAPWVPASPRCSPATASPSSAWSRTTTASSAAASTSSTRPAARSPRGKLTEEEQAELLGRITLHHLAQGPHRRRPRGRGGRGVASRSRSRSSASSTAIVRPGRDPGDQHLVALGHRDLHRQRPARPGHRRALLQPGAGAGPRRDRAHRGHRAAGARRRLRAGRSQLGKNPVVCGDKAGFIANTLLFGYLNHAVSMYEGHYASREDIDAAMRFGCGYPMGPLALLDLIGLDTAYEILETMYRQGRDRLHAPAPILKQMVTAGMLGRKTGRGFYTYEGADSPVVVADDKTPSADDKPQLRARHQAGRRRRHRHDGHRHRRGLRQGRLRRRLRRPLAGQGRRRASRRSSSARSTRRSSAASSTRTAKAEVLGRLTGSTSLDDLEDVDIVVEAIAEDLHDQDHAVREPRRDLQARRDPRHHDVVAADHRAAPRPPSGRRTSSACTSSTRRRS